jgi:hypothetical protein
MAKTLLKRFRDEPIGSISLVISFFAFVLPFGRELYKDWDQAEPKFSLRCEELSRTKAFYQGREALSTRSTRWSSVLDKGPPINGFIASFAHCEYYNLQSTVVSIREIVNTYYYDRSISNELPNFREFFDPEKTNRLVDVVSTFPVAVAPGRGFGFTGLFLFPVGDLVSVKDELCQRSLARPWTTLGEIDRCVELLHGKPLVNLLYEGQGVGFGSINAVGLVIVRADNLEIYYRPSMQYMPFLENDKFERLRIADRGILGSDKEEVWTRYQDESNKYVRIGNQHFRLSFWSILGLIGFLFWGLLIFYLSRHVIFRFFRFVWTNCKVLARDN